MFDLVKTYHILTHGSFSLSFIIYSIVSVFRYGLFVFVLRYVSVDLHRLMVS